MFVQQGGVDSCVIESGEIISTGYNPGTKWKDITILNGSLQQKDSKTNVRAAFSLSWSGDVIQQT